jgi:cell division protein FtsI (penicillin-binding protein 3)
MNMAPSAHKKFNDKLRRRLKLAFTLIWLCLMAVSARVFYMQIIDGERLSALARGEYEGTMEIQPRRGDIYDQRGTKLAATIEVGSLYANPAKITDKIIVAGKLSPIVELDKALVLEKLSSNKPFVWIKRKLSPQEMQQIEELKIDGLGFIPESQRVYPHRSLAAHVLGFVGMDGKGLGGLEHSYEIFLRGAKQRTRVLMDARKRIISQGQDMETEFLEGSSVTLTLDAYIQHAVEEELALVVSEQQARSATAIVMEPSTGRILAMAVHPTFNPNIFSTYPEPLLRNKNITDCYEPGSTMKAFTASLVLEKEVAKPTDVFFCENGRYRVGNHVIRDVHDHGWLSLQDIIKVSSNIGALKVGELLQREDLYQGLLQFGFGQETGVDIPGETRGILSPPRCWSAVGKANICFGQGISASPIQLITAFSAVANGGIVMKPYMVDRVVDARGNTIVQNTPQPVKRAISSETAKTMAAILQHVVEKGGTGVSAAIDGYAVAGKTGTAQKVEPGTRSYSRNRYVSSFIGFLPADNPCVAMLVIVDEPKKQSYGGLVAAPVFKAVCQRIIPYWGIKPCDVFLAEKHIKEAMQQLKSLVEEDPEEQVDGKIDQDIEFTAEEGMPNVLGMDLRSALSVLDDLNVEVSIAGTGFVARQDPIPGQSIKDIKRCKIWLSPQKGLES